MKQRVNLHHVAREGLQSMLQQEAYIKSTAISPKLRQLIKIRASQINGCAYCLDLHINEARAIGETQQRLDLLNAWRESPFYTDEERAALELTEAVTLIATSGVSDDLYQRVRAHFDERQFVDLLLLINQINSWNRLNMATGRIPQERV